MQQSAIRSFHAVHLGKFAISLARKWLKVKYYSSLVGRQHGSLWIIYLSRRKHHKSCKERSLGQKRDRSITQGSEEIHGQRNRMIFSLLAVAQLSLISTHLKAEQLCELLNITSLIIVRSLRARQIPYSILFLPKLTKHSKTLFLCLFQTN